MRFGPAVCALVAGGLLISCAAPQRLTLAIRNGLVYDGDGAARVADIGVQGDRIVAVGDLSGRQAATDIDAAGKVVSPGFIELEGGSGLSLLTHAYAESHLRQGITTEILADPLPAVWTPATEDTAGARRLGITVDWSGLGAYLDRLERRGPAVNVGTLIPFPAAGTTTLADGAFGAVIDDVALPDDQVMAAAAQVRAADGMLALPAAHPSVQGDGLVRVIDVANRLLLRDLASRTTSASGSVVEWLRSASTRAPLVATLTPYSSDTLAEAWLRDVLRDDSQAVAITTGGAAAMPLSAVTSATAPATVGAYPRLLGRFVREAHALTLREAIRRVTAHRAQLAGLAQRGRLAEDHFADIVVFDAATIGDRTAGATPQAPTGLDYVIVNGVLSVTPEGLTGARAGYALRRRRGEFGR